MRNLINHTSKALLVLSTIGSTASVKADNGNVIREEVCTITNYSSQCITTFRTGFIDNEIVLASVVLFGVGAAVTVAAKLYKMQLLKS